MKPSRPEVRATLTSFSIKERLIWYSLAGIGALLVLTFLWQVNQYFLVEVPSHGGSLTEGVIGTPRFINPVLANTDADRDLATLVYSGLMRLGPDGTFITDLAESYTAAADGLSYVFTLKKDLQWHDGKPLTADDVIYTISLIVDPSIKSPRRAAWEGIKAVKIDDQTIQFNLKQPYLGFLENATLGILPMHLWKETTPDNFAFNDLNTNPIGSGPFYIKRALKTGEAISGYDLNRFDDFALGQAYLDRLSILFYPDENKLVKALTDGEIESAASISGASIDTMPKDGLTITTAPLLRVFGIFFNQNQAPVLAHKEVRQALALTVDQQTLIKNNLKGYGSPVTDPLLLNPIKATTTEGGTADFVAAKNLLESKGWVKNSQAVYEKVNDKKQTEKLAFTITTSNTPELKAAASFIQAAWKKLGADVEIKTLDRTELTQSVIRPRKYDAVLFGEVLNHTRDPFAFWHSSQRFDPGRNIALYANPVADKLIDTIRASTDPNVRTTQAQQLSTLITTDTPAAFIYSPSFIYAAPTDLQGITFPALANAGERFTSVYQWYRKTDKIWKIFIH